MSATDDLYSKFEPDIQAIAEPLFEFSEAQLRKRGNFLPHGAVLTDSGEVRLAGAAPNREGDLTNSEDILPLLQAGLRSQAKDTKLRAVGISENVTVTRQGNNQTKAIKVLIEHVSGLTIACYLPFNKRILRGYEFGESFSIVAEAEINAWPSDAA